MGTVLHRIPTSLSLDHPYLPPSYILDSGVPSLQVAAGVRGGQLPLTEVIFSKVGDYELGFSVSFPGQGALTFQTWGYHCMEAPSVFWGRTHTGEISLLNYCGE